MIYVDDILSGYSKFKKVFLGGDTPELRGYFDFLMSNIIEVSVSKELTLRSLYRLGEYVVGKVRKHGRSYLIICEPLDDVFHQFVYCVEQDVGERFCYSESHIYGSPHFSLCKVYRLFKANLMVSNRFIL